MLIRCFILLWICVVDFVVTYDSRFGGFVNSFCFSSNKSLNLLGLFISDLLELFSRESCCVLRKIAKITDGSLEMYFHLV